MIKLLIRLLLNAAALVVIAEVVPGIDLRTDNLAAVLLVALIFGLVNTILRPILTVLSCPFIIVTLGLFLLVINGALLLVTDELAGKYFEVDGWGAAILGGLIMGIIGLFLEMSLKESEDERD